MVRAPNPVTQRKGLMGSSACEDGKANSEFVKVEEVPLGPSYVVGLTPLAAGNTAKIEGTNLGNFTLKPALSGEPEPLCTGLSSPTTLLGRISWEERYGILFTGCTLVSHPKCDVLSLNGTPTTITVPASDELVYTGKKEEAEKK